MKSRYFLGAVFVLAISFFASKAYAGCEDEGGSEGDCHVTSIHPDCTDNARPRMCTVVVNKLITELADLKEAFRVLNGPSILSFFHPSALIYTFEQFYRGRDAFRDGSLTPTLAAASTIDFGASHYRFQVVNENVAVTYGDIPTTITLKDGSKVSINVRQAVTWIRTPGRPDRQFVVYSDYDQTL